MLTDMALDTRVDKVTKVISPEIQQMALRTDETSIRTVRYVGDAGNFYDVEFKDGVSVPVPKEVFVPVSRSLDFVPALKEGDRVILVRSGRRVNLLYGPLNEDHLYVDARI